MPIWKELGLIIQTDAFFVISRAVGLVLLVVTHIIVIGHSELSFFF